MRDVYENKKFIYILMECVEGGELFEHIKNYEISGIYFLLTCYRKGSSDDNLLNLGSNLVSASVWDSSSWSEARKHSDWRRPHWSLSLSGEAHGLRTQQDCYAWRAYVWFVRHSCICSARSTLEEGLLERSRYVVNRSDLIHHDF